jgi:hypothetical protein
MKSFVATPVPPSIAEAASIVTTPVSLFTPVTVTDPDLTDPPPLAVELLVPFLLQS